MKNTLTIFALIALLSLVVSGQQPTRPDPLLDCMTGRWILQGTIAGRQTTHDIKSGWVLNREYVRMHETSREKNGRGQPAYEAIVFTNGTNRPANISACGWILQAEAASLLRPWVTANATATKSRSCSTARTEAASTQPSATTRIPTTGSGLWTTKSAASSRPLPA
jgi:hypothetical protein